MKWNRILTALVALIAIGVVAAVIYLETSNSASPAATTTTTTTTLPPTTTTTTLPPTTTLAPTTSTTPPTTVPPTTLPPTTTLPPPDRALVPVVVSSGPSNGQRLQPTAQLLAATGWTDIRPLTGSTPLIETVVFFADGFQASAEQLLADAGLPLTSIAPLAEAPPVAGLANAQLLVYLGGS